MVSFPEMKLNSLEVFEAAKFLLKSDSQRKHSICLHYEITDADVDERTKTIRPPFRI